MRRLTIAVGLALVCLVATSASALAFGEFTASRLPVPCSEEKPCTTKGVSIESEGIKQELSGKLNQKFKFGPFEIYCVAKAKAKTLGEGAISWELSPKFATEILFGPCEMRYKLSGGGFFTGGITTVFRNPETNKNQPIKFIYKHNGSAEFGAGEAAEEAEIIPGEAIVQISGKTCKISWPSQKVPLSGNETKEFSFAKYSQIEVPVEEKFKKQFPTLMQKRLIIHSRFTNMEYNDIEGQCKGEGGFEQEATVTSGHNAIYEGSIEYTLNTGNLGFE
jgi:hypothetical protein